MSAVQRNLGVVMDPIDSIKPVKDSTLAMLLEAQARGWRLHYMEQRDLYLRDGEARAQMRPLEVEDDTANWFSLGPGSDASLGSLHIILMRKDPPFDMEYIYTTYILGRAEEAGVRVVNRTDGLRDVNEKAYTAWFPHCCPPTLISRSIESLRKFQAEQGRIVVKPLDGMGGRSIFVAAPGDPNTSVIFETITDGATRFVMAQRFIPDISTDGDKRILLIEGEPVPYALARIPAPGDSRGNLAAGARSEGRPLTERDRWLCEQVGPTMRDKGLAFVGLDVIGDYVTEINVTSPTCIRELDREFDLNISATLFDALESRL